MSESLVYRRTPNQVLIDICKIHGDRYLFPHIEVEYEYTHSRLTAICPVHGNFETTFNSLVRGKHGCRKCGYLLTANSKRSSISDVESKIKTIHGDRYKFPYLNTEYVNAFSEITGICELHGKFDATMNNISKGTGCPKCGHIAIGISRRNISYQNNLADYKSYSNKVSITDSAIEGPHGELQVRCKTCNKYFAPTYLMVNNRFNSINTVGNGESNFYCSDKCKSECTVYNKKNDNHLINNTGYEAKVKVARNCQKESRYILRQIQMSLYGYHFCEKCGKVVENNQLHHTIEVAKDPSGAITPAGHMLVCDPCHKEFTARCRGE